MTKTIKRLLPVFILICVTSFGFAQSNEIIIRYIGNCGLHITDGTSHIYTDFPYKSGAYNYLEYDASEIENLKENSFYIFTHRHADHYSKKLLKKALKSKAGQAFGSWNLSELKSLSEAIPNFEIKAFKTKHRFSFNHYSYLITWHNKTIFLSGDTEHAETIGKMTDLDWAFVPAWLAMDANEKDIKIDAKKIGIYHIGQRDKINITGEKVWMLKIQGEEVSIPY